MMNKTFKLSAIASGLLMATSAHAALYKVVEVNPSAEKNITTAVVVEDSEKDLNASNPLGCFGESCSDSSYAVAGNTMGGQAGIPYYQEVPFNRDNTFSYQDKSDLESYCDAQFDYASDLCDSYADDLWYGGDDNSEGGLRRERDAWFDANYQTNSIGFIDSASVTPPLVSDYIPGQDDVAGTLVPNTENVFITNLYDEDTPIGITSSGYYDVDGHYALAYRQRGFYGETSLLPKQDAEQAIVKQMGRTYAYDSFEYNGNTYVVGAAAVEPIDFGEASDYDSDDYDETANISSCENLTDPAASFDCQHVTFAQQAYVWDVTSMASSVSGVSVSQWHDREVGGGTDDDETAQASARAAVVPETGNYAGKPILVGFNSDHDDDDFLMQAAVFYPKSDFSGVSADAWESKFVDDAELEDSDDFIYTNSLLKDINDNLIAIGESKRSTNYPENGSANTEMFVVKDIETGSPSASYINGGIFGDGQSAKPNAINNFNEIVGTVDAESSREIGGKRRRTRGFIYALDAEGTNADRRAILGSSAIYLDNLTASTGDSASSNANQYRILEAYDINDAGVIAARAAKCDGGYDDQSIFSYCGDGNQDEEYVAVKLIPIEGATSEDIVTRSDEVAQTVDRDGGGGGSLGIFGLFGLALVSLRRKFKC
ncbi:MAG: DUF3466 family protein [Vibrio sp.]